MDTILYGVGVRTLHRRSVHGDLRSAGCSLREVKVTMFLPGWMKEYIQPLKDVTEMYCAQHSVDWSEVRVDTKRQLVTHGDDVLAVLRFDGSCMPTPFIMNKQVA